MDAKLKELSAKLYSSYKEFVTANTKPLEALWNRVWAGILGCDGSQKSVYSLKADSEDSTFRTKIQFIRDNFDFVQWYLNQKMRDMADQKNNITWHLSITIEDRQDSLYGGNLHRFVTISHLNILLVPTYIRNDHI